MFLEQILDLFVPSATKGEIAQIRKAIQNQERALRGKSGRRGRRRGQDSSDWRRKALQAAWRRHVLGWTWPEVAASERLRPTKPNLRTLQRRCDDFAALVWRALPGHVRGPQLGEFLRMKDIQSLIRWRTGIPFDRDPEACRKLVLALEPRGLRTEANRLRHRVQALAQKN
jgi:hypothetical protein